MASTSSSEKNLLVQLESADVRRDPLRVTMPGAQAAAKKKTAQPTLAELAQQQSEAIRRERAAAGQPTAVIRLAALDESSIGQLIELLHLSRRIESQLTTDH